MARAKSTQRKIEARIAQRDDVAFLTREFSDLAGHSQVRRALAKMVVDGQLVRLGYGVYGRAKPDSETGVHVLQEDFVAVARQALTKLGIEWNEASPESVDDAHRALEGQPATRIKGRFIRKLSYGGHPLSLKR